MKKTTTTPRKPEKSPAILQELPYRLTELEAELRPYPTRAASERPLKAVEDPTEVAIAGEKVIQFSLKDKPYATGHSDVTYPGSNHARGVRHIRFYAASKVVLDIEGDFEDQQFGSNFRFKNIDVYLPGEWEADLIKLTDELNKYKAKRKLAWNKKRAAAQDRLAR